jgi:hypothetical protein
MLPLLSRNKLVRQVGQLAFTRSHSSTHWDSSTVKKSGWERDLGVEDVFAGQETDLLTQRHVIQTDRAGVVNTLEGVLFDGDERDGVDGVVSSTLLRVREAERIERRTFGAWTTCMRAKIRMRHGIQKQKTGMRRIAMMQGKQI